MLNLWKKFWGKTYRIYKNNKMVCEILIYHHKIYIIKEDEKSSFYYGGKNGED